jgi:NAD(P)-dependent dehydrogenase (short-subunit alcohol dehydrogenase family)
MSFEEKVAYVAGAGGMGLRIAQDLIQAGAHVALADVKPRPGQLSSGRGSHVYFEGDLTDEGFVQKTISDWDRKHGRLDYLVNTTGVLLFGRDQSCLEMDLKVWDRVMATNLKSFVLTSRHAVPAMRRCGGGAMVHFSSIDALRGDDRPQDAYGCSKAAVIRLSKSLAIQLARDHIRSNVILPGPVHTPMQARWDKDPVALARLSDFVPLGRIGTVDDMANACLFLLSDKAAFITGTELTVDGGLTARP